MVKNRNYRFIIFIDDLSFEENEVEYKFLKAVIEGGVETKPDNVLIYATSNRRHLIRETWKRPERTWSTTTTYTTPTRMEEKLSLVGPVRRDASTTPSPTGTSITGHRADPGQAAGLDADRTEVILAEANKWELRHGGVSGRTAQQFINYLAGTQKETNE